jgi:hypothetical protein
VDWSVTRVGSLLPAGSCYHIRSGSGKVVVGHPILPTAANHKREAPR